MIKKTDNQLKNLGGTEAAINALKEGKGNKTIGGSNEIPVGFNGVSRGFDYRTAVMPKRGSGYTSAEFNKLTPEEQAENGEQRGWFEVTTSNGGVSFTTLFGTPDMQHAEFWSVAEDETAEVKFADGYDAEKVVSAMFKPSTRNVEAFIDNNLDGINNKTLTVIARKDYVNPNFDIPADKKYNAKAIAFIVK